LKKVPATLLGLFGAPRCDSAPGELWPPCSPSLRPWLHGRTTNKVTFAQQENWAQEPAVSEMNVSCWSLDQTRTSQGLRTCTKVVERVCDIFSCIAFVDAQLDVGQLPLAILYAVLRAVEHPFHDAVVVDFEENFGQDRKLVKEEAPAGEQGTRISADVVSAECMKESFTNALLCFMTKPTPCVLNIFQKQSKHWVFAAFYGICLLTNRDSAFLDKIC